MTALPWLLPVICLVMATPVHTGCDFSADYRAGRTGQFSSPNFPAPYPGLSDCLYTFQAANSGRVQITFSFFELEDPNPETGCVYDHINMYSVDRRGDKMLLGQYCGSKIPARVVSLHPKLQLQFISDYTKSMKGFLGNYEFLDDTWLPFKSNDPRCGPFELEGLSGTITSPTPLPGQKEPLECVYLLKRKKNQHLLLHFIEATLEPKGSSGGCEGSRVELYNGFPTPVSEPDDQVCGTLTTAREFLSKSARLVIRYTSNGAPPQTSRFKLLWTQVTLSHKGECDGHLCSARDYCHLVGPCSPTLSLCIHPDLRCDHVNNCGPSDNSDETMCGEDIAIICVSVLVPIFVVILIACVTFYYYKKRKVKKSVTLQHVLPPPPPAAQDIERLPHSPSSQRHCSKILHTSFVDGEIPQNRSPQNRQGTSQAKPAVRQVTWNLPRDITEDDSGEVIHEPQHYPGGITCIEETRAEFPSPVTTNRSRQEGRTKKVDFVPLQAMKRPSYHLMKQTYTDDGGRSVIIAEI